MVEADILTETRQSDLVVPLLKDSMNSPCYDEMKAKREECQQLAQTSGKSMALKTYGLVP